MAFRARIKFRRSPGSFLASEGTEHAIGGTPYVLRSGEKAGTALSQSEYLTVSAGDFETEAVATVDGQLAKEAVLWSSTKTRIGVDVGSDREQGGFAQAVKDEYFRNHGTHLHEDVHGLVVVDDAEPIRFASISAAGRLDTDVARFSAAFAHAYTARVCFTTKERLAAEIYNSSFFERTIRTRFLTFVMAIEVLGDQQALSAASTAHVEQLIAQTEANSELSSAEGELAGPPAPPRLPGPLPRLGLTEARRGRDDRSSARTVVHAAPTAFRRCGLRAFASGRRLGPRLMGLAGHAVARSAAFTAARGVWLTGLRFTSAAAAFVSTAASRGRPLQPSLTAIVC